MRILRTILGVVLLLLLVSSKKREPVKSRLIPGNAFRYHPGILMSGRN